MYVPTSDGLCLRVIEAGSMTDRSPVLLIHGFTGSADAWPVAVVEGLAANRQVWVVDLPGHGGSDCPPSAARFDIARIAEDLAGILDAGGAEEADWIGYSMGGRVALAAAVQHPERVRRLVLESASPGLARESDREARRTADRVLAKRLRSEPFGEFVSQWMAQPLFSSQKSLGQSWLDQQRERRLSLDPECLALCLEGLGTGSQPSFWQSLSALVTPALLLTGELDSKFVQIGNRMHGRIGDATHVVVPAAGHCIHAEAPEDWLDHVTAFLDQP